MINNPELVPAIIIKQWLKQWDSVPFGDLRQKPEPHFYMFSLKASALKKLSKVYPRKANENRHVDIGIQRKHDPERSRKIADYINGGFPWSDLSPAKRDLKENQDLRMPGWLPTAIIANILAPNTIREGRTIAHEDLLSIEENDGHISVVLPSGINNEEWDPSVPPIEIIDGQHRLWAFDETDDLEGDFELPVVAFFNLDISWQAYLFYTINIKPKKINASLAFDLYPVLRVQKWLENSPDGAFVYKETRAQELVEVLWSSSISTWRNRINMLGENAESFGDEFVPTITQSAFIRSLISTFIKTNNSRGLGGLYGAVLPTGQLLQWNRTQQATFLIFAWNCMSQSISKSEALWVSHIRKISEESQLKLFKDVKNLDPGYFSRYSLVSTDQGVRGFLNVINDFVFVNAQNLRLNEIDSPDELKEDHIADIDIVATMKYFQEHEPLSTFVREICDTLAGFDWRTASTPDLETQIRQKQMIYKGSSGYKEIRSELLKFIEKSNKQPLVDLASEIILDLGYD